MRVEISVLEPGCEILIYEVESEAECHDEVDRFAYRHAAANGLDCRAGCVLATPVYETVKPLDRSTVIPVGGIGYAWPDDQQEATS